jgi:hypothetical protein
VALPGGSGGRVVVAAFADSISSFSVGPKAGIAQSAWTGGVLLWTDGGQARTVRFKLTAGDRLRQAIPAEGAAFVLNARAQDPRTLPDP